MAEEILPLLGQRTGSAWEHGLQVVMLFNRANTRLSSSSTIYRSKIQGAAPGAERILADILAVPLQSCPSASGDYTPPDTSPEETTGVKRLHRAVFNIFNCLDRVKWVSLNDEE